MLLKLLFFVVCGFAYKFLMDLIGVKKKIQSINSDVLRISLLVLYYIIALIMVSLAVTFLDIELGLGLFR